MRYVKAYYLDMNGDVDVSQGVMSITFEGLDRDEFISCALKNPKCQISVNNQQIIIPLTEVTFISGEFEGNYSIANHDE